MPWPPDRPGLAQHPPADHALLSHADVGDTLQPSGDGHHPLLVPDHAGHALNPPVNDGHALLTPGNTGHTVWPPDHNLPILEIPGNPRHRLEPPEEVTLGPGLPVTTGPGLEDAVLDDPGPLVASGAVCQEWVSRAQGCERITLRT